MFSNKKMEVLPVTTLRMTRVTKAQIEATFIFKATISSGELNKKVLRDWSSLSYRRDKGTARNEKVLHTTGGKNRDC